MHVIEPQPAESKDRENVTDIMLAGWAGWLAGWQAGCRHVGKWAGDRAARQAGKQAGWLAPVPAIPRSLRPASLPAGWQEGGMQCERGWAWLAWRRQLVNNGESFPAS